MSLDYLFKACSLKIIAKFVLNYDVLLKSIFGLNRKNHKCDGKQTLPPLNRDRVKIKNIFSFGHTTFRIIVNVISSGIFASENNGGILRSKHLSSHVLDQIQG